QPSHPGVRRKRQVPAHVEHRQPAVRRAPDHHGRLQNDLGRRSRYLEDGEVGSGGEPPIHVGHVGRLPGWHVGRAWHEHRLRRELLHGGSRQRPRPEVQAARRREVGISADEASRGDERDALAINFQRPTSNFQGARSRDNELLGGWRLEVGSYSESLLYLLFFLSGISGLIYQVVWVRVFGNVFGNTIYSASLIVAVFMLGLGAGSYLAGRWADRRYATEPSTPLLAYGYFELVIAAMGAAIALVLPHLDRVSVLATSYQVDANGWYVLTPGSYVARVAIALTLITPITLLMGGTLTLLIRYLVRSEVEVESRRIAVLYAVNTAGAAAGCFLTDFALVPAWGLLKTQRLAVGLNVVAGVGAVALSRMGLRRVQLGRLKPAPTKRPDAGGGRARKRKSSPASIRPQGIGGGRRA